MGKLVNPPPCHGGDHEFESRKSRQSCRWTHLLLTDDSLPIFNDSALLGRQTYVIDLFGVEALIDGAKDMVAAII